jgi:hypothetical protein
MAKRYSAANKNHSNVHQPNENTCMILNVVKSYNDLTAKMNNGKWQVRKSGRQLLWNNACRYYRN